MGRIIVNFSETKQGKPSIYIDRRVDDHETQKLKFSHEGDSWLSTESGNSMTLFGRDREMNMMEVQIPISPEELKEALEAYLKSR